MFLSKSSSIRRWWQPPRKLSDREKEREVTWLELFYDLVYVVLIARVAESLAGSMDARGIASFTFLFAIVWLAWFNGALYHDQHGNRDMRTRVFTFLQMFAVAGMAVFAEDALGETAAGFAIFFTAFLLILSYLWWRSGVYEPALRRLTRPNALAFAAAALIFFLSVFLPAEWQLPLWTIGLAIILFIPLMELILHGDDSQAGRPKTLIGGVTPSLVERFALLTLIVLGEFVSDIIGGVAYHPSYSWLAWAEAVMAMLIAIAFWWIYFDFIAMHLPRPWLGMQTAWMYLHLPMTLGLAAAAAAVLDAIEYAGDPLEDEVRLVLAGGLSLALLSIAALMRIIRVKPIYYQAYRRSGLLTALCAVVILLLGFTDLRVRLLLLFILLLLLVPVIGGVRVWIDMMGGEEMALQE